MCPIFTNPVDWLKTLSNGVKTHLLKLKTSKFSLGATPPPAPPAVVVGKQVKDCWGKKLGARKNEKKRKCYFYSLELPIFISY